MDDNEYWNDYYKKNSKPTNPSSFAQFILPKLDENKNLIELGCGNGRDSIYFSENGLNVIAVDQVCNEIEYLNKNHLNDNVTFVCGDFTKLSECENELICGANFDYVYSRFTFHSINEIKEDRALDWISDVLAEKGLFLLEARSMKDPMLKRGKMLSESENFTNHYRRYMDLDKFVEKLENRNFEIIYQIEDKDLAVYKDDNPYVIRIIAKK